MIVDVFGACMARNYYSFHKHVLRFCDPRLDGLQLKDTKGLAFLILKAYTCHCFCILVHNYSY